jgi:polyphosphate kinase
MPSKASSRQGASHGSRKQTPKPSSANRRKPIDQAASIRRSDRRSDSVKPIASNYTLASNYMIESNNTIDSNEPTGVSANQPLFLNRELSWLDFNHRVLQLAADETVPLLERVKFLAIFATNLDEFFMKRIGGLHRQRAGKLASRSLDGLTVHEQLKRIHARIHAQLDEQVRLWFEILHPALKREGIQIRRYDGLDDDQKRAADDFFRKQVFPILTPLAVDPAHPFPFISNLSKSMGVLLEVPARGNNPAETSFVRIKLPDNLPRWVKVPAKRGDLIFVPLESVIGANLQSLFPGLAVLEHHLFRVTRNADVETDEEDADDLLAMVTEELRRRRMAGVVRLEIPLTMSPRMRQLLVEGLEVDPTDVYLMHGPLDMDDLIQLSSIDRPDLKYDVWHPIHPPRLGDESTDFLSVIRAGDVLVHHPYESFKASVERFVESAVNDPKVLAIKMTLYRTSQESPFVPALIRAAEAGKQVAVLIELKARFDEQRNVELAQRLEKAGVHVVYGIVGLKTHTKLTVVVREETDGLRTYAHIGTGNYNSRTAQLYGDLGLFTCDPGITSEIIELFHSLTGVSLKDDYKQLLIAPVTMRKRFLAMIDREIDHARNGRRAHIWAKMNALQDEKIIRRLYQASSAGVQIDLIVRGFCCLIPGVPGMSENIRIRSILGRFLEHSRIYRFHNAGNEEIFLGSADWMSRNLDWRVEAITPVIDPAHQQRIRDILDINLSTTRHVWQLNPDGKWSPVATASHAAISADTKTKTKHPLCAQEQLMRITLDSVAR